MQRRVTILAQSERHFSFKERQTMWVSPFIVLLLPRILLSLAEIP